MAFAMKFVPSCILVAIVLLNLAQEGSAGMQCEVAFGMSFTCPVMFQDESKVFCCYNKDHVPHCCDFQEYFVNKWHFMPCLPFTANSAVTDPDFSRYRTSSVTPSQTHADVQATQSTAILAGVVSGSVVLLLLIILCCCCCCSCCMLAKWRQGRSTTIVYGSPPQSVAPQVLRAQAYPVHSGIPSYPPHMRSSPSYVVKQPAYNPGFQH